MYLGVDWCRIAMFSSEHRMVSAYATVLCCVFTHGFRMCCARVINGVGTGVLNAIVPVWSAEVATHTSRGAFIASEFTLNIFGVVVAYWMEFGLGFVGDGTSQVRWRVGKHSFLTNVHANRRHSSR
jgi:MFS family permease